MEWLKKSGKSGTDVFQNQRSRGGFDQRCKGRNYFRSGNGGEGRQNPMENSSRGVNPGRDRSKVKCFNCNVYGHYTSEYHKPRREKEVNKEVNLSQIQEDVPALLLC